MGRLEFERSGAAVGVLGVGLCGANVSPSNPGLLPARVAPGSWLMPEPQEEQNFAVSDTADPHCEQNMGAVILSPAGQQNTVTIDGAVVRAAQRSRTPGPP